tara:strand:- start:4811 stop:5386 length:576 start_codon:yes stop_codon:yes gene_type:complete
MAIQGAKAASSGVDGITMEIKGLKEIDELFKQLPHQVDQDKIWGRFWKVVSEPLVQAAKRKAPLLKPGKYNRTGVAYPPDPSKTIARGTLRDSIQFFRTPASKGDVHGAYVGPRVKGKYRKNKGGYFGAWVEYGHKIQHAGMSKANPFMKKAFSEKANIVLMDGYKKSEDIFNKALKTHKTRLEKYGTFGY